MANLVLVEPVLDKAIYLENKALFDSALRCSTFFGIFGRWTGAITVAAYKSQME